MEDTEKVVQITAQKPVCNHTEQVVDVPVIMEEIGEVQITSQKPVWNHTTEQVVDVPVIMEDIGKVVVQVIGVCTKEQTVKVPVSHLQKTSMWSALLNQQTMGIPASQFLRARVRTVSCVEQISGMPVRQL